MLVEYMAIYIDIYGLIPPKIYSSATETPPGRDDGRHYRAKVRWMDGKSFFPCDRHIVQSIYFK